jgi:hypothetical protein
VHRDGRATYFRGGGLIGETPARDCLPARLCFPSRRQSGKTQVSVLPPRIGGTGVARRLCDAAEPEPHNPLDACAGCACQWRLLEWFGALPWRGVPKHAATRDSPSRWTHGRKRPVSFHRCGQGAGAPIAAPPHPFGHRRPRRRMAAQRRFGPWDAFRPPEGIVAPATAVLERERDSRWTLRLLSPYRRNTVAAEGANVSAGREFQRADCQDLPAGRIAAQKRISRQAQFLRHPAP